MSDHAVKVSIPGAQTEEGIKRISAAIEARNQADYECFLVLRDLMDEGFLSQEILRRSLLAFGSKPDEADEIAVERYQEIEDALKARREADAEFCNATVGRSG